MAFHESNFTKFKKLITNPKTGIKKIIPFFNSKIVPYKRDFLEFLGIDRLSRPYREENKLLKYINRNNGFFIECGGNDGHNFDPTYYLEKFLGWRGIIIEPLPIGKLCIRNRKKSWIYQVALVPFGFKDKNVNFIDCNAMSFIEGTIENQVEWIKSGEDTQKIEARKINVPAKTIQKVIDEHKLKNRTFADIDFFVIDVEGYELEVLKGLDFSINSPNWIMAEAHTNERFNKIKSYLEQKKYSYVSEIGYKDFLFKLNK